MNNTKRSTARWVLERDEARNLVDALVATIRQHWDDGCDAAELTAVERRRFWGRQFLNPHVFET